MQSVLDFGRVLNMGSMLRTESKTRSEIQHESVVLVGRDFGRDSLDDSSAAGGLRDSGFGVVGGFGVAGVRGRRAR